MNFPVLSRRNQISSLPVTYIFINSMFLSFAHDFSVNVFKSHMTSYNHFLLQYNNSELKNFKI